MTLEIEIVGEEGKWQEILKWPGIRNPGIWELIMVRTLIPEEIEEEESLMPKKRLKRLQLLKILTYINRDLFNFYIFLLKPNNSCFVARTLFMPLKGGYSGKKNNHLTR